MVTYRPGGATMATVPPPIRAPATPGRNQSRVVIERAPEDKIGGDVNLSPNASRAVTLAIISWWIIESWPAGFIQSLMWRDLVMSTEP